MVIIKTNNENSYYYNNDKHYFSFLHPLIILFYKLDLEGEDITMSITTGKFQNYSSEEIEYYRKKYIHVKPKLLENNEALAEREAGECLSECIRKQTGTV